MKVLSSKSKMKGHFWFILWGFIACFSLVSATKKCVCKNKSHCAPLTSPLPEKEIFAFCGNDEARWRQYDWSRITTIGKFGDIDPEMVCYAHSKGVRVISINGTDIHNTVNPKFRKEWIQKQLAYIQAHNLDGINVDMEPVMTRDQVQWRDGLSALMEELYAAVKALNPQMQVTFDAPAYPGPPTEGIFPHYYDFKRMAAAVDFYFIMFYDMTGPNVSWANSPLNSTEWSIDLFLKEGVPAEKLLMGVPWYGFNYPCSRVEGDACVVDRKNPGTQDTYKIIVENFLPRSTTGRLFDSTAQSPYLNYKNETTGKTHQVWYDDPQSLKARSDYAVKMNLKGMGMWTANNLDYSNTSQGRAMVNEMWNTLPKYKSHEQKYFKEQENQTRDWSTLRWIATFLISCFTDVKLTFW